MKAEMALVLAAVSSLLLELSTDNFMRILYGTAVAVWTVQALIRWIKGE